MNGDNQNTSYIIIALLICCILSLSISLSGAGYFISTSCEIVDSEEEQN